MPFTKEQFFGVFTAYNQTIWPTQAALLAMGLVAVLFATGRFRGGDRIVSLVLGFLWIWMGAVYHLRFFSMINPAAIPFGILTLLEGGAFLYWGVLEGKVQYRYPGRERGLLGAGLLLYGILAYPLIGSALGHPYPAAPTFGLPCPTTLFTLGILCWAEGAKVRWLTVLPLAWTFLGSFAAFRFGVWEDLGLLAAAAVGILLWARPLPPREVAP